MKIKISFSKLYKLNSIYNYAYKKFLSLNRILNSFKKNDNKEINVKIDISRTTRHHKKGNIYKIKCYVYMPGIVKNIIIESEGDDVIGLINLARDKIRREIEKYKGKLSKNIGASSIRKSKEI